MAEASIEPSHIEAAQRFVEEEVGPRRHLTGAIGKITSALAVGMSLVFLYWAWASVTAQVLRLVFLGLALTLSFLIYPTHRRANRTEIPWHDWLLALASIAAVAYPLWDFEERAAWSQLGSPVALTSQHKRLVLFDLRVGGPSLDNHPLEPKAEVGERLELERL